MSFSLFCLLELVSLLEFVSLIVSLLFSFFDTVTSLLLLSVVLSSFSIGVVEELISPLFDVLSSEGLVGFSESVSSVTVMIISS